MGILFVLMSVFDICMHVGKQWPSCHITIKGLPIENGMYVDLKMTLVCCHRMFGNSLIDETRSLASCSIRDRFLWYALCQSLVSLLFFIIAKLEPVNLVGTFLK